MFSLSRNFLKFAAASAFVALTVSGTPTCADEMAQNLGPVGPHEPMINTVRDAAAAFNYYERPQFPGSPRSPLAGRPEYAGRHRAHQCHKQMLQSGRRLRLFPPLVPHSFLQQVYHRQTGLYRRDALWAPRCAGQPSSASAAELSKFCKATAATVGLSAKDRFMAWCEAEARQVSGVPTEPPGPGMGRALRQN